MLDGSVPESMASSVGFQPDKQPGKPALEQKEGTPNFTDLPPHLLSEENPQTPVNQPIPEEMRLFEQMMSQAQIPKKPAEQPPPIEKPVAISAPSPSLKSEEKTSVQEEKDATRSLSKMEVVWEKVKAIAKKVWYYGSGSFIWDRIFPKS